MYNKKFSIILYKKIKSLLYKYLLLSPVPDSQVQIISLSTKCAPHIFDFFFKATPVAFSQIKNALRGTLNIDLFVEQHLGIQYFTGYLDISTDI